MLSNYKKKYAESHLNCNWDNFCICFAYSGFELQTALVNTLLERYISIVNHTFQKSLHIYCAFLGPDRSSKSPKYNPIREYSIYFHFPKITPHAIKQCKHLSNFG